MENSKNYEKEDLPKDYVSPIIICIQQKLMKTLTTLLWWECDLNAFFTDQTNGRTSIEFAFDSDDLSITELIIKKSKFSSFIIFHNAT